MIIPLLTAWLAITGEPAVVGVTGLFLATYAWGLALAAPEASSPVRPARASIAAARERRGRPARLCAADIWALSTDVAEEHIDFVVEATANNWWAPEEYVLPFLLALTPLYGVPAEAEHTEAAA